MNKAEFDKVAFLKAENKNLKATINNMAEYIERLDVDEDICKKVNCVNDFCSRDVCIDCIKKFFSPS